MNDEQYKRFRKMQSEPIETLFTTSDTIGNIHFLVSGSTGTKYKVTIYPKQGTIICSCPDYSHGAKTQECVCKHCLFVIYKILKLFKDINHAFFKRCKFTPDEISEIKKIYREKLSKNKKLK